MIPEGWKKIKLEEVTFFKSGKTRPATDGSFPIYGGNGILGYANEYNSENEVIIIGRVGAYCGSVFYEDRPLWVSDNALMALPRNGNKTKFLYYLLKLHDLNRFAQGSSHPLLTQTILNDILVTVPENFIEQSRIASILSSLDDKIELNNLMNKTLEAIAQAIFKEWFVDFRFPGFDGELIDGLPKGWRKQELNELIDIKHGYAFKGEFFSENENENILLTPGNFKIGGGFNDAKFKFYFGEIPEEYILRRNDLIVTMTDLSKEGDTLGYSALVPEITGKKLLHNQRLGKIIFKGDDHIKYYLYLIMQQSEYRHYILGSATGSTVKHTSPTRICSYEAIIPDEQTLLEFKKIAQSLLERVQENLVQNGILVRIRDNLLPKLMTGKIRV
jgi:type I restriction enzyme S subunit